MWVDACTLIDHVERMQRDPLMRVERAVVGPIWEPPADILDAGAVISIEIALPGVAESDVVVTLSGPEIIVEALREPSSALQGAWVRRLELPYGRFVKHIALGAGHYEIVERAMVAGCLSLRLTRSPA